MNGATQPRLIVDCGGRIISGMIVTADGRLLPCSQEVRQTAMRHVPAEIAFDRRISDGADFLWDDALEAIAKAQPHQFFARARRIGLHRPWDADLAPEALPLASPIAVLSSAAALADPVIAPLLPSVGVAMLDALLDPLFAFAAAQGLRSSTTDAVAILPAHAARHACIALQKVFRRRGFAGVTIVPREIAAAMMLTGTAATECTVWDVSDEGLHTHRVAIDAHGTDRRFATIESATVRAGSRIEWVQRIAAAIRRDAVARDVPSPTPAVLDRALTAFLTGAPQPATWRLTRAQLDAIVDADLDLEPADAPFIAVGDVVAVDAVRRVLLDCAGTDECAPACDVPVLDRLLHGVAAATLWERSDAARRVVIQPGGTLRINSLHNEAVEVLSEEQLPRPGENCHVRTQFAFRGANDSAGPFLVHLLWGADAAPVGNATVCALRVDREAGGGALRIAAHLRRSRSGRRLTGTVEVGGGAAVRSHFTHEFPLFGRR